MCPDELSGPDLPGVVADAREAGLDHGVPPLDFATVADRADEVEWEGQTVRLAGLASLVAFKRLAGRPRDRLDLAELEAIHGPLPIEPIPGLDT